MEIGKGEICTIIRSAVEEASEEAVRVCIVSVMGGAGEFKEQDDKETFQPGKGEGS